MSEQRIAILPAHEAAKIAAGEVVERPASALKELLENAHDAGASEITIHIEEAGKGLIRVIDNGIGMSRKDAEICFEAHATSKVRKIEDLADIESYGFRGEALAAIDAVSKVRLITAQQDSVGAVCIERSAGKVVDITECGARQGTDIAVSELFFNTPARRKFLKRDETEWNTLFAVIRAFVLSHLDLHYRVYRDGKLVLNAAPVATLTDRAAQVWEYAVQQHLVAIEGGNQYCSINGAVSCPELWRYNRSDILLFVNGRWVKNQMLVRAVVRGYGRALPPGKYPLGIIHLMLDTSELDLNVHPRKEEIQISKSKAVERLLEQAVVAALEKTVTHEKLSLVEGEGVEVDTFPTPILFERPRDMRVDSSAESIPAPNPFGRTVRAFSDQPPLVSRPVVSERQHHESSNQASFVDSVSEKQVAGTIIGQFFKTYILVEKADHLLWIDQHAAHERILYERMKQSFEVQESHPLLFPLVIQVTAAQVELLAHVADQLRPWGFEYEIFGNDSIRLNAVPPQTERLDYQDFFQEVVDILENEDDISSQELRKRLHEHVHSHTACKAAVQAGDILDHTMMKNLLAELEVVENRHMCIHGRPTMWRLSNQDLAKKFRRP